MLEGKILLAYKIILNVEGKVLEEALWLYALAENFIENVHSCFFFKLNFPFKWK